MAMEELACVARRLDGLKENGKRLCVTKEDVLWYKASRNAKEKLTFINLGTTHFALTRNEIVNALHQVVNIPKFSFPTLENLNLRHI